MSAPGADLAAIRQRYVSRSQVRRLTALDAGRVHDDICAILKQWDTHQSALRALVAELKRDAKKAKGCIALQQDQMKRQELSGLWLGLERAADAVERLLSGPQP